MAKTPHPNEARKGSDADSVALFKTTVNKMLRTPPKAHDDMRSSDHKAVPRKKGISKKDSGDE